LPSVSISSSYLPISRYLPATLLSLRPILSLHGCYGDSRALKLAKELAENNHVARVLVVYSEITLVCFAGPNGSNFVSHALFGDGADPSLLVSAPNRCSS
jgi:bisdemethoxycurcumin synthase